MSNAASLNPSISIFIDPSSSMEGFTKYLIINHESWGWFFFNFMLTFVSLGSSYLYLYCAAFRISFVDYNKEGFEHSTSINNIMICFELIFAVQIFLSFFLSYKDDETQKRVVTLKLTASKYLHDQFLMDLIPLVPLQFISLYNKRECLFYIIKANRLLTGFQLFEVHRLMDTIKIIYKKR